MSFIGDFFNHEKAVQERFEQLEALNDVLAERQEEICQAEQEITKLDSEILTKRKELADLLANLQLIHDIEQIKKAKIELQQQLIDLQSQVGETYLPKDIIFAAYKTLNGADIVINAFHYIGEVKPEEGDGVLYQSLNGDRLIGFSKDFDDCLIYEEGDSCFINAEAETFLSFSEACIKIGNPIYLNKRVSALDVNKVLIEFTKLYRVCLNDDEEYSFKRKRKINKQAVNK